MQATPRIRDQPEGVRCDPGRPGGDGDAPGHVRRRYELPDDATSPRQFQFELYKRRTTMLVPRGLFLHLVCQALALYKYLAPNQRNDLNLACRIRERKESVTVLLCGSSGCGKSTLYTLLGSRLGITTIVSTDSIRECLDPVAVSEAKARRKAKKHSGMSSSPGMDSERSGVQSDKVDGKPIGKKQMAIEGYKAQSEMVIDSLDRLITAWEDRKESVVVEGVHLSLNCVIGILEKAHGHVSKAWPVESGGGDGKSSSEDVNQRSLGNPIYGPLNIGRTESVNLQFGSFGISAWPTDSGCTSQVVSADDSWSHGNEGSSSHVASSSGSPNKLDGHHKEIKESSAASGSDNDDEEEADVAPNSGSDDDLSEEDHEENHDEMEGSVDEDCNRSDEEYDDLAIRDSLENAYLSDDSMVHMGPSNGTSRKQLETLRSLPYIPETAARSPSSNVSSARRNAAARKVRRTLSDSSRSRPRSYPSLAEAAAMEPKGLEAAPVAPADR
ncbi:unnamed protein product [Alopecurus aequalis]